VTRKE